MNLVFLSYVCFVVKFIFVKEIIIKNISLSKDGFSYFVFFDLFFVVICVFDLLFINNFVGIFKEGVYFVFLFSKFELFVCYFLEEFFFFCDVFL